MKCEICLDEPKEATVRLAGMYCCAECFEEISPNIKTDALEKVELL